MHKQYNIIIMKIDNYNSSNIKEFIRELQNINTKKNWVWLQDGHLYKITNIFEKIKYLIYKDFYDSQIKSKIDSLIDHLEACGTNYSNEELKVIFFQKLAFLNTNIFDRSKIAYDSYLEFVLCPKIQKIRRKINIPKKELLKHPEKYQLDPVSKKNFQEVLEETRFAIKLGIQPTLCKKGSSGTYFLRNRLGEKIGIFKPIDEGPHGRNNPRFISMIKKRISFLSKRKGFKTKEIHLAEIGSSKLDEVLNLNIIPKTQRVTLISPAFNGKNKEKDGSLQLFVDNAKEAQEYFPQECENEDLSLKIINFEKLALLDFLIFNIDRTFDNWFLQKEGDAYFAVAIDNATAFPIKHTKEGSSFLGRIHTFLNTRHQYMWENLQSADKPFSFAMKKLIESLDMEKLRFLLKDAMSGKDGVSSFSEKMRLMDIRIKVLKQLTKRNATLREIAAFMKTKNGMQKVLESGQKQNAVTKTRTWDLDIISVAL
ncbi:MAG: hypothetical protein Tsb0015_06690 [Simkaniaceae bacterium]